MRVGSSASRRAWPTGPSRAATSERPNFCPYGCGPLNGQAGYVDAFYELADMMGIGAQAKSPAEVWQQQMKPRLAEALTRTQDPAIEGLVEALRAVELARHTDAEADWQRATRLTDAALAKHRQQEGGEAGDPLGDGSDFGVAGEWWGSHDEKGGSHDQQ